MKLKTLFFLTALCLSILQAKTSEAQLYVFSQPSKISIDGSSTLHDWSAAVNVFEGTVVFDKDFLKKKAKSELVASKAEMKFEVESMDGGRGATMNTKIFNALKKEEHPYILFSSTKPIVMKAPEVDGKFKIDVAGDLTVAGVSRPTVIELEGERNKGNIAFKGTKEIKFSDFGMERPSAMFGQIVTGDELTINFDLLLIEKETGN